MKHNRETLTLMRQVGEIEGFVPRFTKKFFARVRGQIDGTIYLNAERKYKAVHGSLPCRLARTSRLKKKRRTIVMKWYRDYFSLDWK